MTPAFASASGLLAAGNKGDSTAATIFAVIAIPLFILVVAALIYNTIKQERYKRNFKVSDHWRADGRLQDEWDSGALPFESFKEKAGEPKKNVHMTVGPDGNRQWVFVRWWSQGKANDQTANAITEVPLDWTYLGVKRRRLLGRGYLNIRRMSLVDIDDAEFSDRFEVRAKDARFARAFLTDDVRAGLLAQKKMLGLEIEKGLFWVRLKGQLSPAGLDKLAHWQTIALEHTDPSLGYAQPPNGSTSPQPTEPAAGAPLATHPLHLDLSEIE